MVAAALPVTLFASFNFQIGFVNQVSSLKRVSRRLTSHMSPCHQPQFVIDERHQLLKCVFIPLTPIN